MSFDVFLQCYGELAEKGLQREYVRALFPVAEARSEPKCWVVEYDDLNSCDIYVSAEGEPFNSFMVSRPAGSVRLWQALLSILQMGSVVMFWPGSPPLLARKGSREELPDEMVKSLGEPVYIERVEQFFELLKTT